MLKSIINTIQSKTIRRDRKPKPKIGRTDVGRSAIKATQEKLPANFKPKSELSTGFFDSANTKDQESGSGVVGDGRVFGISISKCIQNDKVKAAKDLSSRRRKIAGLFDHTQQPRTPLPLEGGGQIPSVVVNIIAFLEERGLHTVGLFRVSPSLKRVRQIREELDGGGMDVVFGEDHNVHDVAALLKEFLRDLPEPLLTRALNPAFLGTLVFRGDLKLQRVATLHLIKLLPPANRDTLDALLCFLAKVAKHAKDSMCPKTGESLQGNQMNPKNLATCLAPNFLPLSTGEAAVDPASAQTREREDSISLIEYLISNYQELFGVSDKASAEIQRRIGEIDTETVEEAVVEQKALPEDASLVKAETTSCSVFEGSEPGGPSEMVELLRRVQRLEDILHKDGGKGGSSEQQGTTLGKPPKSGRNGQRDANHGDAGDSDGSPPKSRSFRRGRQDSSGTDKVKSKRRDSSLGEQRRASSLDSVTLQTCVSGSLVQAEDVERKRSSSTQSLKVPELLSRQQSSPILDGSGVITASLKVPVPLDDSDTPFIEEDHFETSRLVLKREEGTTLSGKVRHQIGGSIETGIGPSGGDTPSSQEKNGANVAGVIKSKIADFEKLAKKPMYLPKSKSHHTL